jgi:hypothetical protein
MTKSEIAAYEAEMEAQWNADPSAFLARFRDEMRTYAKQVAAWNKQLRAEAHERALARAANPKPGVKGVPGLHGPLVPGPRPPGKWAICPMVVRTRAPCAWCRRLPNHATKSRFLFEMMNVAKIGGDDEINLVCRACAGLSEQEGRERIVRARQWKASHSSSDRLRR